MPLATGCGWRWSGPAPATASATRTPGASANCSKVAAAWDFGPSPAPRRTSPRPTNTPLFAAATAVRQGGLLDQLPRLPADYAQPSPDRRPDLALRFHDLPEAVRNLAELAEQLSSDVLPRQTVLPPAKVPRGLDEHRYLRLLCERGLHRRGLYGNPAAHERLGEELVIIEAGGLSAYFLVVRDIARYARRRRLPMALRGSAGNSLVCYLLEITDVDPLRFGLALDRFLHIGRPDLPDIDLDFDWQRARRGHRPRLPALWPTAHGDGQLAPVLAAALGVP